MALRNIRKCQALDTDTSPRVFSKTLRIEDANKFALNTTFKYFSYNGFIFEKMPEKEFNSELAYTGSSMADEYDENRVPEYLIT